MSDEEFFAAFEGCTLPPADFHHREHLRAGWICLRRFGLLRGLGRFSAALRRFAAHAGSPGIYHETITWAYLLLLQERMRPDESWESFAERSGDLLTWRPSILERYYRKETLGSEEARRAFVPPDA